jgi:hypothetical protein
LFRGSPSASAISAGDMGSWLSANNPRITARSSVRRTSAAAPRMVLDLQAKSDLTVVAVHVDAGRHDGGAVRNRLADGGRGDHEPPGSFQFGHLHFDWVLRIAAEGHGLQSAVRPI